MDDTKLAAIVEAIVRELKESGAVRPLASGSDHIPDSVSTSLSSSSVVPVKRRAQSTGTETAL